ncbi:hypothetical protein AB1K84_13605 [Mesobacillus foraminis]|uniref:hypothetical protein n=1 Tax=Mesobacillus foraminis TaxID=279826 RepID=UPI0039A0B8EC
MGYVITQGFIIAGEYTAIPMGVVIFSASFTALLSSYGLLRKTSSQQCKDCYKTARTNQSLGLFCFAGYGLITDTVMELIISK